MNEIIYQKLTALTSQPAVMAQSVAYIASHLKQFLKRRDKVLILFPDQPATVGRLMKEAVLTCDAVPMFLEKDQRWMTILKTAFVNKCDAIIGPPLTILVSSLMAAPIASPL